MKRTFESNKIESNSIQLDVHNIESVFTVRNDPNIKKKYVFIYKALLISVISCSQLEL